MEASHTPRPGPQPCNGPSKTLCAGAASRTLWLSRALPRFSLAALVLCLASGLILAFQYRPWGDTFASVEHITGTVPYGFFFRRLHWVSGQVFVILVLLHAADHLARRVYRKLSFVSWAKLWAATAVALFLLFTGFILKADQEAVFAARIMQELTLRMPLAGSFLARLLVDPAAPFFLPWLHHCLLLTPLMVWLLASHVRRWLPDARDAMLAGLPLLVWSVFIPLSPAYPPTAPSLTHVTGPWFFLGVQEMLRHMDPLLAGVVLPVAGAAGFLSLPLLKGRGQNAVYWLLCAGLCGYAALSVRMALRGAA